MNRRVSVKEFITKIYFQYQQKIYQRLNQKRKNVKGFLKTVHIFLGFEPKLFSLDQGVFQIPKESF